MALYEALVPSSRALSPPAERWGCVKLEAADRQGDAQLALAPLRWLRVYRTSSSTGAWSLSTERATRALHPISRLNGLGGQVARGGTQRAHSTQSKCQSARHACSTSLSPPEPRSL